MRTHGLPVTCALALLILVGAMRLEAQPAPGPLGGRAFVHLNGMLEVADREIERSVTFPLYDEDAAFRSTQDLRDRRGLVDVGGGYRLLDRLAVGLTYTRSSTTGSARVDGSLPHPRFFGRPRGFDVGVGGLERTEHAVHLQAIWLVPFTEEVSFAVSAGPSIFRVRQALARGVRITEVPPDFNTAIVDIDVAAQRRTAGGVNVGGEGVYRLTRSLGAGLLIRYTYGSTAFTLSEGQEVSLGTGGFQVGLGLRARF
jgi:hypothetical protein